jgi:hypothetical protein
MTRQSKGKGKLIERFEFRSANAGQRSIPQPPPAPKPNNSLSQAGSSSSLVLDHTINSLEIGPSSSQTAAYYSSCCSRPLKKTWNNGQTVGD